MIGKFDLIFSLCHDILDIEPTLEQLKQTLTEQKPKLTQKLTV
jgi:hypothetical protein